jgi:membrane-bound ClpP family serine protease
MFKFWLHSPMARLMILGGSEVQDTEGEGGVETELDRRERLSELQELIGLSGVTITALRPVGTVRIEGRRVDAMAETGVIEADTPIVVCDIYDNQIKVRPE